jgi:hypothetical protein
VPPKNDPCGFRLLCKFVVAKVSCSIDALRYGKGLFLEQRRAIGNPPSWSKFRRNLCVASSLGNRFCIKVTGHLNVRSCAGFSDAWHDGDGCARVWPAIEVDRARSSILSPAGGHSHRLERNRQSESLAPHLRQAHNDNYFVPGGWRRVGGRKHLSGQAERSVCVNLNRNTFAPKAPVARPPC